MTQEIIERVALKEHELVEGNQNYARAFAEKTSSDFGPEDIESYFELMDEPLSDHDLTTEEGLDIARAVIEEDIKISIEDVDGYEVILGFVEDLDEDDLLKRADELGVSAEAAPAP
jgi:hypothetical protein